MKSKKTLALIFFLLLVSSIQAKSDISSWFSHSGDFRYRYQLADTDKDNDPQRVQNRVRLRYGIEAKVDKKTTIKAGLESGDNTPKNANTDLGDGFSSKSVYIDYAYSTVETHYGDWLIGKMHNPLYFVSDMMWDTDIRPEGVAFKYKNKDQNYDLTAGYFILSEIANSNYDPNLIVLQAKKINYLKEDVKLKVLATIQSFDNLQGKNINYSALSNSGTINNDGSIAYNYNPHIASLASKLVFKNFKNDKNLSVYAEYYNNTAVSEGNQAGLTGVTIGNYKLSERGNCQTFVNYRHIQKDGLVDILTDFDAFYGKTNIKGWELGHRRALSKKSSFGLTFHQLQELTTDEKYGLFQADYLVKF